MIKSSFSVMQPYIFPYLGYYQLVSSVESFVFYDDVTFIKGGYINRNSILLNGHPHRFTLPLIQASSNKKIKDIDCHDKTSKILKSIEQSYSKAPYFLEVMPIIEKVMTGSDRRLSTLASSSIIEVFKYLNISKEFFNSSELNYERRNEAAVKLILMSKTLDKSNYVNPLGGEKLYNKDYFLEHDLELHFLKKRDVAYFQGNNKEFFDNLSMIDVLMWCSKNEIHELLTKYEII
ncbi:WbqC family protein [Vibrio splendidus]